LELWNRAAVVAASAAAAIICSWQGDLEGNATPVVHDLSGSAGRFVEEGESKVVQLRVRPFRLRLR
jgi:hypothetical protein